MPSTRIAESPDVTKNTSTNTVAIIDISMPNGSWPSMVNSAVDRFSCTACAIGRLCQISICNAVPPKTENQTKAANDGAMTVPTTNSRTVRPLDTRAMNKPTNGDQEIHHAQ